MRPSQLMSVLDREFLSTHEGHHTPVMVWGPPGVGKSQIIAQIASRHDVAVIDIRLSQMEPSDLRGIPFRVGDFVEWAVPAILPNAERHGQAGILFLDEITSAPPSVSAAAYQLILDGWAIFAAGNRQGDRGVTYTMPAPLANRFSHFELDTHLDDWVAWAYANGIDERLIAFLRFRPELLFDFDPTHNPVAFPSPRSWEFAHRALQKFGTHTNLLVRRPVSNWPHSSRTWINCRISMPSCVANRYRCRAKSICNMPSPAPWSVVRCARVKQRRPIAYSDISSTTREPSRSARWGSC
jgi:AAA domain (dynein-related subfamily)